MAAVSRAVLTTAVLLALAGCARHVVQEVPEPAASDIVRQPSPPSPPAPPMAPAHPAPLAGAAPFSWPPTGAAFSRTALACCAQPVFAHLPTATEAHFKGRGPWKKSLPTLLQTLEALGRAQCVQHQGASAWRG